MAYDVPANLGWIAYIVCFILIFTNAAPCAKSMLTFFGMIPAVLLLIGIGELISERIVRLDRILPFHRLMRGFGVITVGSFLGGTLSTVLLYIELSQGCFCVCHLLMAAGGFVCGIFALLLFKGYKRQVSAE